MKKWIIILLFFFSVTVVRAAGTGEIVLQEARFHLGDAPAGWTEPGFDDTFPGAGWFREDGSLQA